EAGRNWLKGAPLYPGGDGWDCFPYSPLIAALFVPGAFLADAVGSAVWRLCLGLICLGGLVWWSRSALPCRLDPNRRALLLLLVLPLTATTVVAGQMGGLVLAALLLALAAAAEERWTLSAVCVVLACLLKAYPLAVALLLAVCYP